jgi:integrase
MKERDGLYQRGRIWWASYYANGERQFESTGTANKGEARTFRSMRISEVHRGVFVKDKKTTLDELWDVYLPHAKATGKKSVKRDEQLFKNLRAFCGNVLLREITPVRIMQYQQSRVQEVTASTVNRETALLKHLFNLAEVWDLHVGNPHRKVKLLREDNQQRETITWEEQERFLAALPRYVADMVLFDLMTGLRVSDLRNLKWGEVILEGVPRIRRVIQKTGKLHEVALNETAIQIVMRQDRSKEYVFTNPIKGTQVKSVRVAMENAVKRAGLKKITWHMFRHTVANRLLDNGANTTDVMAILGHESYKTVGFYVKPSAGRQKRHMDALAGGGDNVVTMPPRVAVG